VGNSVGPAKVRVIICQEVELPVKAAIQSALLQTYSIVNKSGVLDSGPFCRLFTNSYFLYKRWLEDPFYRLGKNYPGIFSGGRILDVGANIGYTALVFAEYADSDATVYAFEPDKKNFTKLVQITQGRRPGGAVIECINAAVGAETGSIEFWHNASHHGDHRVCNAALKASDIVDVSQVKSVKLIDLDSFTSERGILDSVAFVKIDVQGYELPVCQGMEKIAVRNQNMRLAIEYMPSAFAELGFKGDDVLDFMEARGFSPYIITPQGLLVDVKERTAIEFATRNRGYCDLLFSRTDVGSYKA